MSGLKLNVEKTRAIWIRNKRFSNDRLCQQYKLDRGQGPFKILGVYFSANVNEIWNINTHDIINKITHLLNQWSRRKLTIIGKITIVKSLVLSKFVHFFISLPDPPPDLLKELEKQFYRFIWNKGPDRIRRKVLIKKYIFWETQNDSYTKIR